MITIRRGVAAIALGSFVGLPLSAEADAVGFDEDQPRPRLTEVKESPSSVAMIRAAATAALVP
jgi:hypothetical protein